MMKRIHHVLFVICYVLAIGFSQIINNKQRVIHGNSGFIVNDEGDSRLPTHGNKRISVLRFGYIPLLVFEVHLGKLLFYKRAVLATVFCIKY